MNAEVDMLGGVSPCPFCAGFDGVLFSNQDVCVIPDRYPVSTGHFLIIPTRHIERPEALTDVEWSQVVAALRMLAEQVSDYNFGVNVGAIAGQSIAHCHFHFIPRRAGDVADPFGGIRNVIPGKGRY